MPVNSRLKATYPKTRTSEPSDGFLHLRKTSLDTRWEVEHFTLSFVFLVAGLVNLGWESLNFSNAPNTEKEMQLYSKIASRFEKHLLRAKFYWVSSSLWLQWHNPLIHSPQIVENTLLRLEPIFSKIRKCLQYLNQL